MIRLAGSGRLVSEDLHSRFNVCQHPAERNKLFKSPVLHVRDGEEEVFL